MTDPQETALMKEFDTWQIVGVACKVAYGQCRHFAVPAIISKAAKEGLLMSRDGKPVVGNESIYNQDLMLTDAGREKLGLPKVAVPRPAKKVEKTLF